MGFIYYIVNSVEQKAKTYTVEAISSATNIVFAETTMPTPPTFETSEIEPTKENVILTINYNASDSSKLYRIGAGEWTPYFEPLTITANTTDISNFDFRGELGQLHLQSITIVATLIVCLIQIIVSETMKLRILNLQSMYQLMQRRFLYHSIILLVVNKSIYKSNK